jgi:hypothetical protein
MLHRNFGKGLALERTGRRRDRIDKRLLTETRRLCRRKFKGNVRLPNREACLAEAKVVYQFVSDTPWGHKAFFGEYPNPFD